MEQPPIEDRPDRPRAHAEVIAELLWRSLTADRAAPGGMGAVIGSLARAAEALAGQAVSAVRTVADAAMSEGPSALVPSLLARIRGGAALRQDLAQLFAALLRAAGSDTAPDTSDVTSATEPAPTPLRQDVAGATETPPNEQTATEDLSSAIAEIGVAISDGVRQATAAGLLEPGRSADSVAWALTSLLMTLIVRAREDEDVEGLVAVAVSAMEDLLPPSGRTA